jgi:hypothetical protein
MDYTSFYTPLREASMMGFFGGRGQGFETEAKDKVWDKIESVENCKAQYFDHEIFIDEE